MDSFPVCGPPPLPGAATWNTDPALLLSMLAGAVAILGMMLKTDRQGRSDLRWGLIGWIFLAAALISPLCNASVALFSLRVTQHLVVTLLASAGTAMAARRLSSVRRMGTAIPAMLFAALLWTWHLPGPYAATFNPDGIAYWLMHLSLAVTATWCWAALLANGRAQPVASAIAALFTAIQMAVLGALLTFAPRPLFPVHAPSVTLPWGLTPLQDQQLGGLLMWVPGGLLFLLVLGAGLAALLRQPGQGARLARITSAVPLVLALLAGGAAAQVGPNPARGSEGLDRAPDQPVAPVGVLTTTEVTTGTSGRQQPAASPPEDADWRTRVLAPVCNGVAPQLLQACRWKSGL